MLGTVGRLSGPDVEPSRSDFVSMSQNRLITESSFMNLLFTKLIKAQHQRAHRSSRRSSRRSSSRSIHAGGPQLWTNTPTEKNPESLQLLQPPPTLTPLNVSSRAVCVFPWQHVVIMDTHLHPVWTHIASLVHVPRQSVVRSGTLVRVKHELFAFTLPFCHSCPPSGEYEPPPPPLFHSSSPNSPSLPCSCPAVCLSEHQ